MQTAVQRPALLLLLYSTLVSFSDDDLIERSVVSSSRYFYDQRLIAMWYSAAFINALLQYIVTYEKLEYSNLLSSLPTMSIS